MVLMSLKIDLKLVAVTCIFLGIFLGFYVDSSIISKPKIEALTEQTESQLTIISGLEQDLTVVQTELESLESLYNEQIENNVPVTDFQELQETASEMEEEITTLTGQVSTLSSTIEDLQIERDDLQDEYDELVSSNSKLQERFDEIYNPGYVAFTYDGLDINLTVTKIKFEGNTPIEGKVTVRHSNGNAFEGTVKLRIIRVITKVGSPSDYFEIHGESEYYWSNAFVSGAGSYKLSISELLDDQGEDVVSSNVLRENFINIFMG